MLEIVIGAIGAGIGIATGAALSTTAKGKEIDGRLNETWNKMKEEKTRISDHTANNKLE